MLQISRSATKFTEEFDFTAMNEKFNKDEVWGHLGKSSRAKEDADDLQNEDSVESSKVEVQVRAPSAHACWFETSFHNLVHKFHLFLIYFLLLQPVYVKDDFFDSLSCDSLGGGSRNGRTRFSEQMRRDTEVLYSIALFKCFYVCMHGVKITL